MIPVTGQEVRGLEVALDQFQIGLDQPQPRSFFALWRCNQKAQISPNNALGDAQRGPNADKIRAKYPASGGGSPFHAHGRKPEAPVSPSGALGAIIDTYHAGMKQLPPRGLCPG